MNPRDPAPVAAYLEHDLPCQGCGYNLRGLPVAGACPECAMPIRFTRAVDLLRFANPTWLAAVESGVRWTKISVFALAAATYFGGLLMFPDLVPWPGKRMHIFARTGFGLMVGGLLLDYVGLNVAVWRITTPNPGTRDGERKTAPRKIARTCVLVSTAGSLLAAAAGIFNGPGPALTIALACSFVGASSVLGGLAFAKYLDILVRRLGGRVRAKVGGPVRSAARLYLASWSITAAGIVLVALTQWTWFVLLLLAMPLAWASGLALLIVPMRLSDALARERAACERLWEEYSTAR